MIYINGAIFYLFDQVYDVTKFVEEHLKRKDVLLKSAGNHFL